MKRKHFKSIILLLIIGLVITFFIVLSILQKEVAEDTRKISSEFPQNYKPYIDELKKKFPNWSFKALYTNMDWNYVISKENVYGKNLVPKSYTDSWKNTKAGQYNVEIDKGWVDCSKQAVEYAMDPRNFLNQVRVFQFEELSYDSSTNSIASIEKILYGTEFYQKTVEYKTASGKNIVMNQKYSDLILKAAKTSDVSAFHLASRIKQEVGPFLSHNSISGTVKGYEGYYNFYNIGATSSSEPMGAIKNGLQYAKDGKGANQATKNKFLIPWDNKEKAITGGAIFIGSSYINLGQNSIYLQKFHVNDKSGTSLFWHQYMTNVLAPYSESKLIYSGYEKSEMLNSTISFIVPVYDNMPDLPCISPSISSKDYTNDNTKVIADTSGNLNIRTGPGTSYEVLTSVKNGTKMIRIAKGKQSGELWDRVRLDNGLVGYVFQNYVKEIKEIPVEKIEVSLENSMLQKGERVSLNVQVLPKDATNKTVTYKSSDSNIVSVDQSGKLLALKSGTAVITLKAHNNVYASIKVDVYSKVTGLEIKEMDLCLQVGQTYEVIPTVLPNDANNKNVKFYSSNSNIATIDENGMINSINSGDTTITIKTEEGNYEKKFLLTVIPELKDGSITFSKPLEVIGNQITGLQEKNKVEQVLELIDTKYRIEVQNYEGKLLKASDFIGTGSKIRIFDGDSLLIEYKIIIYGDINGDGKIDSIDLLVLQRHILGIKTLSGVLLKAGNIDKNGKKPSSADLLKIQRHILGIKLIEQ